MSLNKILLSFHLSTIVTTLLNFAFSLEFKNCYLIFILSIIVAYSVLTFYKCQPNIKKISWLNYWLLLLFLNFFAQNWVWDTIYFSSLASFLGWNKDIIAILIMIIIPNIYLLFLLIFFYITLKYIRRLKWDIFWIYLFLILSYWVSFFEKSSFSYQLFFEDFMFLFSMTIFSFGWCWLIFPLWYWIAKIIKNSLLKEIISENEIK